MPIAFHPFSTEHLAALAVGGTIATAFILLGKKGGNHQKLATALLAFLNFSAYPLGQAAWLSLGVSQSLDTLIPLHLCDIAAITAGFALLTRKPILCALTYFWGLAATLQGLLTPAITVGFPSLPFIMFFIHHFAVVTAALYLPIVFQWRPNRPLWKVPFQILGYSLVYLSVAMTVNFGLGSNFGFASHPPENPSLIDYLGPWPWYLFAMQAIALSFFFLLIWPFSKPKKPQI